ncbi:hypothetical protein ACSS6W_001263 [Trichoderma asperelloides]
MRGRDTWNQSLFACEQTKVPLHVVIFVVRIDVLMGLSPTGVTMTLQPRRS